MATKKSLLATFKELGINGNSQKIIEYLKTHSVGVLKQSGGHSYGKNGTEIKILFNGENGSRIVYGSSSSGGYLSNQPREGGGKGNTIYFSEMTTITNPFSIEGVKSELKAIEADQKHLTQRKKEAKDRMAFLKETGVDSFTPNEYKAYMTLKTFNNGKLTDVEKAQAIAKLIDA